MVFNRAILAILLLSAGVSLPKFVVPNFPSFRLKTSTVIGDRSSSVHTLYMQGARSRSEVETLLPKPGPTVSIQSPVVVITQCDAKRTIAFDPAHKTFSESPILELSERVRKYSVHRPEPTGPQVSISVDSVDTGDRRNVGPFVARHVTTTTRVEPAAGAAMHASVETRDGWYIDLPQLNCEDWGEPRQATVLLTTNQNQRVRFSHTGSGKTGFPVEEVSRTTESSQTFEVRTQLLEVSSEPIDPALFELPSGYVSALQSPLGTDFTRPDTLINRASAYWTYLEERIVRAFH